MNDGVAYYFGWFDPDRKKPAAEKLADAVDRHVEKYGVRPDRILVSGAFGADPAFQAEAERQGVALAVVPYVPVGTIYVGIAGGEPETEPEPEPAARGQLALDWGVAA